MVDEGLIDEAKSLLPFRHFQPLNTVGYKELFEYFDGKHDLDTAIQLIKRNTRRYAKRQLTWFRKDKNCIWLPFDKRSIMFNQIKQHLNR
jgi:tRNA dimethylallyltransferase